MHTHWEMKAVYVCQSGRKQFLVIAVPLYLKVQIVLFTVLQTNKTRTLPNIPFLLKKFSSRRYSEIAKQLLWIELPHLPSFQSADPAGSFCSKGSRNPSSLREDYSGSHMVMPRVTTFLTVALSLPSPSLFPTHMHTEHESRKEKKLK